MREEEDSRQCDNNKTLDSTRLGFLVVVSLPIDEGFRLKQERSPFLSSTNIMI